MNESAELSAAAADVRIIPSMRDIDESWRRCCRRLRAELGENVFTSWFGRLTLDSIEDGRAQFSVPTRFLKSWIEAHYSDRILAALEAEIGGVASVAIGLRSSMGASAAPAAATVASQVSPRRSTRRAGRGARRSGAGVARRRVARRGRRLTASRSPVRRSIAG